MSRLNHTNPDIDSDQSWKTRGYRNLITLKNHLTCHFTSTDSDEFGPEDGHKRAITPAPSLTPSPRLGNRPNNIDEMEPTGLFGVEKGSRSARPNSVFIKSSESMVSDASSTPIGTLDGRRRKRSSGDKHRPLQFDKSGSYAISGMCKKRGGASGDRKAARVLSLIAAAFILTWTPYNVLVILQAFGLNVTPFVWTFFYWLCYINSTLNPICYGVANETFRKTFVSILRCKKTRTKYNVVLTPVKTSNHVCVKKQTSSAKNTST
ncbi:uncharacterized protein LOC142356925 [Convolutriloba macropyga]